MTGSLPPSAVSAAESAWQPRYSCATAKTAKFSKRRPKSGTPLMRIEEFLKAIPKVSPHVHLMGSVQAQTHARSVPTDDSALKHDLGVEYRIRADTARDGLAVW
jgi:hypothetical protein